MHILLCRSVQQQVDTGVYKVSGRGHHRYVSYARWHKFYGVRRGPIQQKIDCSMSTVRRKLGQHCQLNYLLPLRDQ